MNLDNFEKEVDEMILLKGHEYYENGSVTEVKEIRKNEWSATVKGFNLYHLKITIKEGEIIYSECSCLYDTGPVCKHEVALYYKIRDELAGKSDENSIEQTTEERLKELFQKMKKEELLDIIIEQALNDDKFYNYLLAQYEMPGKNESKEYYKKFIQSYLNAAMGRHGFIDYFHAHAAAEGASHLIEIANTEIEKKEYEKAVCITQSVVEEMVPSLDYSNDSSGYAELSIKKAFDVLHRVSEQELPDKLRLSLFNYCIKESEKKIYDDYGSWQYDFIEIAIKVSVTEAEMKTLLDTLDSYIRTEIGENHSLNRLERFSTIKYKLLNKMGRKDEAEDFFISNLHFPDFRRKALSLAFEKMNYDRVIELALEGEKKDGDKNLHGLVREWKKWRFNAYTEKKDNEGIRKLSFDFLLNDNDITFYEEYKKTFSDGKWEKSYLALKTDLKEKAGNRFSSILADILVKEKEFPLLLEMIKQHPGYVSSYQGHFLNTHPEEIFNLHVINIRDEAALATDRKKYQSVCANIKNLTKLGGKEQASQLVREFRNTYKNRRAFQDELAKMGE